MGDEKVVGRLAESTTHIQKILDFWFFPFRAYSCFSSVAMKMKYVGCVFTLLSFGIGIGIV